MNNRLLRFTILCACILFTRVFDFVATYIYTPDLKKEANPLASIFGLGWTAVIITQVLLIALIFYFTYYNIFKPISIIPNQKKIKFQTVYILYLFW